MNKDGVIVVNKEAGYTSRDVVNIVSKCLGTKKIGHAGTLDPLAEGVLLLVIGKGTKICELVTGYEKEYVAVVKLGISTDTLDITGNILKEEDVFVTKDMIEKILKSFLGESMQEVPLYSAVKINGKKLYEYARSNKEVALPSRKIYVYDINIIDDLYIDDGKICFKFRCLVSKGTYIRSLIRDIGLKLGVCACMVRLVRTRQGEFSLDDSYTLDDIRNNNYKINRIEDVLCYIDRVVVYGDLEFRIRNGNMILNVYNKDMVLFLSSKQELLAIYKVDSSDNTKLKSFKMFS